MKRYKVCTRPSVDVQHFVNIGHSRSHEHREHIEGKTHVAKAECLYKPRDVPVLLKNTGLNDPQKVRDRWPINGYAISQHAIGRSLLSLQNIESEPNPVVD